MRRKKRTTKLENPEGITDLEVARKMLKIFQSAQDRKLDFDLSFQTVKQLLSFPACYYTGKEFEEEGAYARSFDRIDSDKGYVEGNVVACTIDINSKKSNLTFEEIELLYNKLISVKQEKEKSEQTDEIFAPLVGDNSDPSPVEITGDLESGSDENRFSENADL
jgi:hypothetical protein